MRSVALHLYVKLALATGVPFGVVMAVSHLTPSVAGAAVSGGVFGILMSAVIGTLQLRADRAAERQAAAQRRVRMTKKEEVNDGDQPNSNR